MQQLTSYEDGKDSIGHLDRYTSWIELQGANDAIMCRAFPLTFRNRAMSWFKKLPQRSIRRWNDLSARAKKHISAEKATSDQEDDKSDRRDNVKSKEKDLKSEKKESPWNFSTLVGQDPPRQGSRDTTS
ncbi:Retrotrans gag domain-containing protein [Abeliophyllum distichum]|uniref:Retrotrans gag domain-containing protein n=1 Tax=Abeliophyllum distichum TaxID=126358 RepID=A0ABD1SC80_9LAMI